MLSYKAWEIRNGNEKNYRKLSFKNLEKNMLRFLKRFIQKTILLLAKYWFILVVKVKKLISENWPKVKKYFWKEKPSVKKDPSLFAKVLLESKSKIRNLKKEIEEENK